MVHLEYNIDIIVVSKDTRKSNVLIAFVKHPEKLFGGGRTCQVLILLAQSRNQHPSYNQLCLYF